MSVVRRPNPAGTLASNVTVDGVHVDTLTLDSTPIAITGVAGKGMRVYANATGQTYTNFELSPVDVNATDFNDDTSLYTVDLTANTVTVAAGGLFLVKAQVKSAVAGTTSQRFTSLYVNGVLVRESGLFTDGGTAICLDVLRLSASDYVTMYFYTDTACSLVTDHIYCTGLTIAMIGN